MTEIELLREIGNNIDYYMKEAGMTQMDLAREIGVSKSTISMYINGERMPTIKNLINITYAVCCDITDIITIIDEQII